MGEDPNQTTARKPELYLVTHSLHEVFGNVDTERGFFFKVGRKSIVGEID
jgi:hypothetical protein